MVVSIAIRPVIGPVVSGVRPVETIAVVWAVVSIVRPIVGLVEAIAIVWPIAIVRLVAIAVRLVAIAIGRLVAIAIGRSWGSCGNCKTHA